MRFIGTDDFVANKAIRPAGIKRSSLVEQPVTCSVESWAITGRLTLLFDMLVIVQHNDILGTELQTDNRAILLTPIMESGSC